MGLLCVCWAVPISGVVPSNTLTTGDTNNTFPIIDTNEAKGGPMFFDYTSALRTIPESRKRRGMLVHIRENDTYYQAYSTHGHYWQRFTVGGGSGGVTVHNNLTGRDAANSHPTGAITGLDAALAAKLNRVEFDSMTAAFRAAGTGPKGDRGWDGRDGKDGLSCTILDGTRSIVFDENGQNPRPSTLEAFSVFLREGRTLLTPTAIYWFLPVDSLLTYPELEVDGMQLHRQTFLAGIQGQYSPGRNNYVKVDVEYTTAVFPFNTRTCSMSVSVDISQRGPKGLKGDTASAIITPDSIFDAMSAARNDKSLNSRPATPNRNIPKKIFRDYSGNVRMYIDAWGYQYFRTPDGDTVVVIQTDGVIYTRKAGVNRVKIANDGTVTTYRGNGVPSFEIMTSGRWKGQEGWPTTSANIMSKSSVGVVTWVTGGGGGSETQATILDKINDANAGAVLERKAAVQDPSSSAMIQVRGSNDLWRMRVDTKGQIGVYRNGRRIFGVMTTAGGSMIIGG